MVMKAHLCFLSGAASAFWVLLLSWEMTTGSGHTGPEASESLLLPSLLLLSSLSLLPELPSSELLSAELRPSSERKRRKVQRQEWEGGVRASTKSYRSC